ncbi:hypothetical protein ACFQ60_03465 [Streptomyces zhihengii]
MAGEVQHMLRQAEADVITIPEAQAAADSIHGSVQLCDLAGEAAARIADRASRCLLIGLDIPLLGLAPIRRLPRTCCSFPARRRR